MKSIASELGLERGAGPVPNILTVGLDNQGVLRDVHADDGRLAAEQLAGGRGTV